MTGNLPSSKVPEDRVRVRIPGPPRGDGLHVLYWMTMARRTRRNFGLQRAVEWGQALGRPLLVLEALRCDYPWASDRLHRFVLDGMADNRRRLARTLAGYHPYVEPAPGAGRGLLAALAERAAVVVTDDYPTFMLPRMIEAASARLSCRFEVVDSNGLLPMRAADRVYLTAHAFRRFLQRALPAHLRALPAEEPLARARLPRFPGLPAAVARRWPAASPALLAGEERALGALPIDHRVGPAPGRGGAEEGRRVLERFVEERLDGYEAARNHPDADGTSGLSPYLHFGHVGVHEVLARLAARAGWTPDDVAARATGSRTGWWRLGRADGFLDQLVTWRELGFNFCWQRPDHARYESLPGWARATLARHAGDPRDRVYTRAELEAAATHDPLWNAAQRQLRREGRLHTYLRMLWGKKILEWSRSPEEALDVMVELNDRYAVDGRDPNSCTGIFWVLGRYDRPWFPERPIFGQVRYMSSTNTARKVRVREYLRRHAP